MNGKRKAAPGAGTSESGTGKNNLPLVYGIGKENVKMKVGCEPTRVDAVSAIDYADMSDYIQSWPDKLVSFVSDRLADDDMAGFARELYEHICEADKDGPAFEEWRAS